MYGWLPVRLREVVCEFLEVVSGHEPYLSAVVPSPVPLGVRGRSLDDLQTVTFLERQLLLVVGRERVQRHLERNRRSSHHLLGDYKRQCINHYRQQLASLFKLVVFFSSSVSKVSFKVFV